MKAVIAWHLLMYNIFKQGNKCTMGDGALFSTIGIVSIATFYLSPTKFNSYLIFLSLLNSN
jgi:hypothetical protein